MLFRKKHTLLGLCALLLGILVSGCGQAVQNASPAPSAAEQGKQTSASATFPKTIKHAKGETVLNERPKKVAITYFPYAEHLFAIGEQASISGVVGLKFLQNFPVYDAFTKQGKITDLGDEASLEKILAEAPDVIIASEKDEKIYDQLSKIAKTIVIPSSENWQDTISKVADVIGEEEKAQKYIDTYNDRLNKLATKMDQTGEKGKTAIFMMIYGKGFNYWGGVRMEPYYKKLGFTPFPNMKDWGEISLEGIADVNPDYIFLGEDYTHSTDVTIETLKNNAVWNNLKAVKNKKLFVIDTAMVGPLAMGQSMGLEVIEKVMQESH